MVNSSLASHHTVGLLLIEKKSMIKKIIFAKVFRCSGRLNSQHREA